MMYYVSLLGLYFIELLQVRLYSLTDFFVLLSVVTDPKYVYSLYMPLLYGICPRLAMKVLYGGALGEWINLVMKWAFNGDRPYWWYGELQLLDGHEKITIQQYFNTCETGPGNPSGHVTINGIVLYVICADVAKKIRNGGWCNRLCIALMWFTYAVVITCLAISRSFIAAHFPHQCLFGLVCGLVLGRFISKFNLDHLPVRHYVFLETFIVVSVGVVISALAVSGIDPDWSVALAQKWCANSEWIHVGTSPFFVCWRFMAAVLAVGIVINSPVHQKLLSRPLPLALKLVVSVCGILAGYLASFLVVTSVHVYVTYASVFLTYTLMIYTVGVCIPSIFV